VPLNHALAVFNPNRAEGAALWMRYLANWTVWNHVRTVTSFAAAVLFIVAVYKQV